MKAGLSRVFAVDWSGKRTGADRTIWVAQARDGALTMLENGRTREEVADFLIAEARADSRFVVGLDFAFSMPARFARANGCDTAYDLWCRVEREGERWLTNCAPPFWGRPGRPRPASDAHFRRCELQHQPVGGVSMKSVFQIGGAGAVGTGSIRGMSVLRRLHDAGFRIWPFDSTGAPCAVEIYPRLLSGPVTKSSAGARLAHLREYWLGSIPPALLELAASTEDAFDAAVSALVMSRHVDALAMLPPGDLLEGAIWAP